MTLHRKPYPFFASIEFLTVLVKIGTVSTPFLIAISRTGFTLENVLALLFSGFFTGCLLAAKELEIHQNLYTNEGIAGRNKEDAIANIAQSVAADMATQTNLTANEILKTTPVEALVDFAVKPSLGAAGSKLVSNLLRSIF